MRRLWSVRWLRWMFVAAAIGLVVLSGIGGNSVARYEGWSVRRMSPAALSAKLAPYYRIIRPEGAGPFPTALLFSGCDGPQDNLDRWASALVDARWAAVIVDSHGPRGLGDGEAWRLICSGQLLMGSERAGDVLVALADVRAMPFVDAERLALIGASHGGWAIMDLLTLDPDLPFNLDAPPAPGDGLAGVAAVILVYPYCGQANRANPGGWSRPVPTLFLLSEDDLIAPAQHCLEIAAAMAARGMPVRTVSFDGVTHGFDQELRSALSPLRFDADTARRAIGIGMDFLSAVAMGAPPPAGDGAGPLTLR